ncbi:ABC transporter ATP-binding protein [Poseidonocella sedimentorum]|uniref:Amino acid/amide ABC transporter ATP-binding protein 1, HAAT family n=1 Tax=Poseidonocella sedimentorum TaxID=871652 RepID=A0A1I6DTE4_9RHOB|nr:ABC transporter ATP-binding protein [Poseidonocella sedimentorum]SFR08729.1 amino acid/amide ABC transporter ATP-binding protein 1, HAAT family [Poseidonocella sedimentorum]
MNGRLEITGLKKRFGGLTAVNGVSFAVEPGEVIGLLGPNGSGKTTVMNMVSGALRADAGSIRFDGVELTRLKPNKIAKHGVARTFQLVRPLPTLSVAENVLLSFAFGRKRHWGREAQMLVEEKLEFVGLGGRGGEEVGNLTYIDQKRMELARALASEPKLLLLDEWLAGLNPSELRIGIDLVRHLQGLGMSVLLVEHIMEAVRALCSRCVVMSAGEVIASGESEAVLKAPQVISAYLGDDHA